MNPKHWMVFNPESRYTGRRRGWPTFILPNGVRVLVSRTERNIFGDENFERAVVETPSRRIHLAIHEDDWCRSIGHPLFIQHRESKSS